MERLLLPFKKLLKTQYITSILVSLPFNGLCSKRQAKAHSNISNSAGLNNCFGMELNNVLIINLIVNNNLISRI